MWNTSQEDFFWGHSPKINACKLRRRALIEKGKGRTGFILLSVAPACILFAVFMLIPTFNVFRISLFKWGGYSDSRTFVGLSNFVKLFSDMKFIQAFQNTILLLVVVTIITFGLALLFANLLIREKLRHGGFFRVVFYIPNILSVIVIASIFSAIYDPANGLFNSIARLFTNDSSFTIYWLGNQTLVIYSVAIAMIWQAVGYYMVMYMASMAGIDESLYESASLEGCSKRRQFFDITLPLIWTNIRTTLTFFIISSINMSFLFVTALTDGGPDNASQVFLGYMYTQAYTNSSYGYGMAIGTVVFIFSFALSAIVNKVTEREVIEY